jgi:environmental stress-induced protein Ves
MTGPMEVVEYHSISPTPWKNGRGVTRNLFDDATESGAWTWRVSIAEITGTQPYSPYPGVRRGQVALGPGAVDLRIDDREVLLDPEGIVVFDGEAEVTATPREAGFLDLNVMTRRDTWESDVSRVEDPGVIDAGDEFVVLVTLGDSALVDGTPLARLDGVKLAAAASAEFRGRFVVARIAAR